MTTPAPPPAGADNGDDDGKEPEDSKPPPAGTTTEITEPIDTVDGKALARFTIVGAAVFVAAGALVSHLADSIDKTPLSGLIPLVLGVAGALAGAGLVFLISEASGIKKTVTFKPDDEQQVRKADAGSEVLKAAFGAVKDLSVGKTLLVLAVALVALVLWTAAPDDTGKDDKQDTGQQEETSQVGD